MRLGTREACSILTLGLALLVAGCAGKEERAADHAKRAAKQLEKGRLSEAEVELRSAVALQPRNAGLHRRLAEVYRRMNDVRGAFQEDRTVVGLDPSDGEARMRLATIYTLGRHFQEGAAHAEKATELLPNRYEPYVLLARARAGLAVWDGSIAAMQKAIELARADGDLWVELAEIHLGRKDPKAAETVLREGLKALPSSAAIRANLANLMASTKRFGEADAVMEEFLRVFAQDAGALRIAAQYRLKRGDRKGAETLLEKAASLAASRRGERLQILAELADLRATAGDLGGAESALREIRSTDPHGTLALASLANLYLLSGQVEKAESAVRELVKKAPRDRNTRLVAARLDLAKGSVAGARKALEQLVQEAPGAINDTLFLAKAYAASGEWEKARASYLKVLAEVPDHVFATIDLAAVYLRLGRPGEAIQILDKVMKGHPGYAAAKRVRADALLASGRQREAEAEYRSLLKASPGDLRLEMRLGDALEVQGKNSEALLHFQGAQSLAPKAVDPVLRQMVLLARLGRLGDAERVGTEYLKAAGEVPPILNALASQAMGRKDFATAGAYVKRSLAADPKAAATREAEALLFLAQRDQTGARLALNEALKHSPDRVSSLALLAELLAKQGKREEARGVYERILQLDRENVLAANNLAVIYLEDSAELTEALRLAELAVEKGRRGPRTLDTLGWVQVKMGTYETAAKTLEEARKGLLKDPEVAFHLGVAYQKLRKNDQARKLLKEALDAPQKGDWAIDAGQALQELDAAKL